MGFVGRSYFALMISLKIFSETTDLTPTKFLMNFPCLNLYWIPLESFDPMKTWVMCKWSYLPMACISLKGIYCLCFVDLEALGTRLNQKVPLRDKDKIFYRKF